MNEAAHTPYYRNLLRQELEDRTARNSRYSLRSFASALDISPQRLSDLIRGRYGLSATQAQAIAERLGLTDDELKRFVASAEMLHSRSALRRKVAQETFASLSSEITSLNLDSFEVISVWYHCAILELTYLKKFNSDSSWISTQLGISKFMVEQAIGRMERLGLLTISKSGKVSRTAEFIATPTGIPNKALRSFHKQILEKAIQAIDLQHVDERDVTSTVMAIDRTKMNEAKQDLKHFRRKFMKKYGTSTNQNAVYCLGMQFFNLSTNEENKK
jgi:uncharacterized protein (TIGR02147 family)